MSICISFSHIPGRHSAAACAAAARTAACTRCSVVYRVKSRAITDCAYISFHAGTVVPEFHFFATRPVKIVV